MRFVRAVQASIAVMSTVLIASLVASRLPAWADTLAGRAEVIDGDTIAIAGVEPRIRLYGIDAPEGQQTCLDPGGGRCLCGSRAADPLASLIGRNGRVTCEEQDRDRHGRIVALCGDLNAQLLAHGLGAGVPRLQRRPIRGRRGGGPAGVARSVGRRVRRALGPKAGQRLNS